MTAGADDAPSGTEHVQLGERRHENDDDGGRDEEGHNGRLRLSGRAVTARHGHDVLRAKVPRMVSGEERGSLARHAIDLFFDTIGIVGMRHLAHPSFVNAASLSKAAATAIRARINQTRTVASGASSSAATCDVESPTTACSTRARRCLIGSALMAAATSRSLLN